MEATVWATATSKSGPQNPRGPLSAKARAGWGCGLESPSPGGAGVRVRRHAFYELFFASLVPSVV